MAANGHKFQVTASFGVAAFPPCFRRISWSPTPTERYSDAQAVRQESSRCADRCRQQRHVVEGVANPPPAEVGRL